MWSCEWNKKVQYVKKLMMFHHLGHWAVRNKMIFKNFPSHISRGGTVKIKKNTRVYSTRCIVLDYYFHRLTNSLSIFAVTILSTSLSDLPFILIIFHVHSKYNFFNPQKCVGVFFFKSLFMFQIDIVLEEMKNRIFL